jgi:hypothetical protein
LAAPTILMALRIIATLLAKSHSGLSRCEKTRLIRSAKTDR